MKLYVIKCDGYQITGPLTLEYIFKTWGMINHLEAAGFEIAVYSLDEKVDA